MHLPVPGSRPDIAVQPGIVVLARGAPVIIIRRTDVVAFAIREFAANADQEYCTQLFRDRTFTAFGIKIRETAQQCGYEQSGSCPAGTVPDQTLCSRPLQSL